MGVPVSVRPASDQSNSSETLQRHLRLSETAICIVIVVGISILALVLGAILFPSVVLLASFFFFAYILLFTLPMWAGLLEDDIEEESRRYGAED